MPDFIDRFGEPTGPNGSYVLSSSRQSIITSLLSAGTFVGAILQAFTSDRYGRRGSVRIWSAVFTLGVVIQTATDRSIVQISVGRCIAGLGVGALSGLIPLYVGESAPKKIRGSMLVLYQLQVISGLFLSYIIDLGTHSISNPKTISASWRIPVGLQMLWGVILIIGISFLPESPRHLLGTGRTKEATEALCRLNGVPADDEIVKEAIAELTIAIQAENEGGQATWLECFSPRNQMWKRTINGMMLQFLQQLNGQNFYYYYGDTFFKSAGTTLSPYVIQTILGAASLLATLPALRIIETWGRRRSLLVGALAQATCALIGGVVGHLTLASPQFLAEHGIAGLTKRNKQGGDVLIAMGVLHVMSFSCWWGPTPWVYLGESFPLRIRPKSIALGSATNWFWNFLLAFFAPRIASDIGPLILLIFCGCLIFAFGYVYLFVPEVKGLSLEEVDELYRANIAPWQTAGWKPARLAGARHRVGGKTIVGGEIVEDGEDDERDEEPSLGEKGSPEMKHAEDVGGEV